VSAVWLYIQYGLYCVCIYSTDCLVSTVWLYIQYGLSCVYCVAVYTVWIVFCLVGVMLQAIGMKYVRQTKCHVSG